MPEPVVESKRVYLDVAYSLNQDDKELLNEVARGVEASLEDFEVVYTHDLDSDVSAFDRKEMMEDKGICVSLMMGETNPLNSDYMQVRLVPVGSSFHEESVKLGECLDTFLVNTYHYDGLFYYYLIATPKGTYYEEMVYSNDDTVREDETQVILTDCKVPTVVVNLGVFNDSNREYVLEHGLEVAEAISEGVKAYFEE